MSRSHGMHGIPGMQRATRDGWGAEGARDAQCTWGAEGAWGAQGTRCPPGPRASVVAGSCCAADIY